MWAVLTAESAVLDTEETLCWVVGRRGSAFILVTCFIWFRHVRLLVVHDLLYILKFAREA